MVTRLIVSTAFILLLFGLAALAALSEGNPDPIPPYKAAGTTGSTVLTLPPMEGEKYGHADTRYRLWTAAHGLPYDALPAGGPAVVSLDGWFVTFEAVTGHTLGTGPVRLRAWGGDVFNPDRHPVDGNTYPGVEAAGRAAYEAGLTGFMVYERDARKMRLPTVA
jgi:hypothetical protein